MTSFIRPMSDLHLGRVPYAIKPLDTDKDTFLILAGDITVGTYHMDFFIDLVKRFKKVLYVLGNHEFYGGDFKQTPLDIRANLPEGVVLLDNEVYIQDGYRFIGSTLWTDFDSGRKKVLGSASSFINDFGIISNGDRMLQAEDVYARHRESVKFLEEEFKNEFDGTTVVITHHAPTFKSIHPKYLGKIELMDMNHLFASHLHELVLKSKAKYWFHGHTHDTFDYMVGKTNIICNPHGYPSEHYKNGFVGWLVLE